MFQRSANFRTRIVNKSDRKIAKRIRRMAQRRLTLESLEPRQLLNADWQNLLNALDVNDDRSVAPIDVLVIINELNLLPGTGIADELRKLPELSDDTAPPPFLDVNGDGFVTPLDALLIINVLNEDFEPPVIVVGLLNDTAPGGTNDDLLTFDATLQGTASDRSGIKSLEFRLDGGEPISLPFDREGNFAFDPGLAVDGTDDGLHSVSLIATDGRGQVSAPQLFSFTLDTIAPELTLDLDPAFDSAVIGDRLTNFSTVKLDGQTEPGADVSIATLDINLQADANGTFSSHPISHQPPCPAISFPTWWSRSSQAKW